MTAFSNALRDLADFIETADYDTAGKFGGITFQINEKDFYVHMPYGLPNDEYKAAVRKVTRAIGGTWDKDFQNSTMQLEQKGIFGYFRAVIFAKREAICERTVVGTKTIEHTAVPGYTETVDLVEWDCGSLLSPSEPETVDADELVAA